MNDERSTTPPDIPIKRKAINSSAFATPSPQRKHFKASMLVQPINTSAWQIRGEKLEGGWLCLYFQKSIRSNQVEQPYVRNFLTHVSRNAELREEELGIAYVATRRAPDGEPLVSNPGRTSDGWTMFIAMEENVECLNVWLEAVASRMNEKDITANQAYFKWSPKFAVTSWGAQSGKVRCLQDVIVDTDVLHLVTAVHDLTKPVNRINLENLPLHKYFIDADNGLALVREHLHSLN